MYACVVCVILPHVFLTYKHRQDLFEHVLDLVLIGIVSMCYLKYKIMSSKGLCFSGCVHFGVCVGS